MTTAKQSIGDEAIKEVGLGMPPECFGDNTDLALADQCGPDARIVKIEVARWRVDIPIADLAMGTFGDRFSPWNSNDGQPPPGVTTATNTLATPGVLAGPTIIRGFSIRVLVTPESRRIPGNLFDPGSNVGAPAQPASVDVFSLNDAARALGLGVGQTVPIPADFLYGQPTWKAAYAFENAYELAVLANHQERLIMQPLTQCARIEPFAEAEAAGNSFTSNQETILALNDRMNALGFTAQFQPVLFKRLGSITDAGALNAGIFTPSREEDASITMFGGIGVPQNLLQKDPYLLSTPIYWPAGIPINIQFIVNDQAYQAQFQRWLSVTGGVAGAAGQDLNMPYSHNPQLAGAMPTLTTGDTTLEQTLDAAPVNVNQQTPSARALLKLGPMVFEIGLIGLRAKNSKWDPVIAKALKRGALSAPVGYGSISYLM
jgi:hypothetical protein